MSQTPFFHFSAAIIVIVLIGLGGCVGKSQPPRFYALTSIPNRVVPTADSGLQANVTIGIGPVALADYIDQSRIITRSGDNRIEQAEFDLWSGSLKDNITNDLVENVSYLLSTDRVSIYP